MSYSYEVELAAIQSKPDFTKNVLKTKAAIDEAIKKTGAITMGHAMHLAPGISSWQMMAYIHYLVEEGYYQSYRMPNSAGQYEFIFVY